MLEEPGAAATDMIEAEPPCVCGQNELTYRVDKGAISRGVDDQLGAYVVSRMDHPAIWR